MASPADRSTALKAARRLLEAGHHADAMTLMQGMAVDAGSDPEFFLALGDLCSDLKDDQHARSFWRAAASRSLSGSTRSNAHRRLARDAQRRDRPIEALHHLERLVDDRPDDRSVLLRLLILRMAGLSGGERENILFEYQSRHPVIAEPLVGAVLVLPFTDPARAMLVIGEHFEALLLQGDFAVRAVDAFLEAGRPQEALILADRIVNSPGAGERELNCVLRALKAAGHGPGAAVERVDAHLTRHPHDRRSRLKKAKLLLQLRRWQHVLIEASVVLTDEPESVVAAELIIHALIRLDRPAEARSLRDRMVTARVAIGDERADELVRLDLALADGEMAMERQANAEGAEVADGSLLTGRIDALMAVGDYGAALELITSVARHSDNIEVRVKGIRCATALSQRREPAHLFPEATFRAGISLDRQLPGPYRSVVLVTSTLGAGGAERQIALTAAKLSEPLRHAGMATNLVCRDLRPEYGNRLMLPMLEGSAAEVTDLSIFDPGLVARAMRACKDLSDDDIRLLSGFPLPEYRSIILLLDQFRRLRPEVVHLWQDGIIAVGAVAAMMAGVPRVVCSIRNVMPAADDTRRHRPYLRGVYQALSANPRIALTANSAMGARDYEQKCDLPSGSIGVVRNGLDAREIRARCGVGGRERVRAELGFDDDILILGAVFRLVPAKRPQRWLEVAAILSARLPNLRMLLIGEGPLRAELEEFARQLGISERTVFAGRKAPVEPWIAAMDAMLLSSDVEGLPNVLIEAQALGVPVITTDAGGAREAVDDGVTGRVVEDDAPAALAEACELYLLSADRRARARAKGPGFVAERFGLDRMVRETLDVLGFGSDRKREAAA